MVASGSLTLHQIPDQRWLRLFTIAHSLYLSLLFFLCSTWFTIAHSFLFYLCVTWFTLANFFFLSFNHATLLWWMIHTFHLIYFSKPLYSATLFMWCPFFLLGCAISIMPRWWVRIPTDSHVPTDSPDSGNSPIYVIYYTYMYSMYNTLYILHCTQFFWSDLGLRSLRGNLTGFSARLLLLPRLCLI